MNVEESAPDYGHSGAESGKPSLGSASAAYTSVGIYRLDAADRLIEAGPMLARMLGYASVEALIAARSDFRASLYESPDHALRIESELQAHDCVKNLRAKALHADGSSIAIAESALTLHDADGKKTGEAGVLIELGEGMGADMALMHSEEMYRTLVERSQDGIFVHRNKRILYANAIMAHMLGYEPEELIGQNVERFFASSELERIARIRDARRSGKDEIFHYKIWLLARDGETRIPVSIHSGPIPYMGDVAILGTVRDLSAEYASQEAEERYRNLAEHTPVGIYQSTPDGKLISANPALAHMLGYGSVDQFKAEVEHLSAVYLDADGRERLLAKLETDGEVHEEELRMRRRDGGEMWLAETSRVVHDEEGNPLRYEGVIQDISARKAAEEELRYRATHDALSGLANRRLLRERLDEALKETRREGIVRDALLFIEMDAVKRVNDSLGHTHGDRLLKEAAARLRQVTRPEDTVCNYGGGQFAVLAVGINHASEAQALAERIEEVFDEPFRLVGYDIHAHAAIGIAMCQPNSVSPETVLREADAAMAAGKRLGESAHVLFDDTIRNAAMERLELEAAVRGGIERGEFETYYQPICDIGTGKAVAFEALLRWNHPERGLLAPGSFLTVAEETGLILDIGWEGLAEVLAACASWQTPEREVAVSFNLSNRQFHIEGLAERVAEALKTSRLPARLLNIEVTEEVFVNNPARARRIFNRLRTLGVHFHLDDFGTGYSGLAYLSNFSFDALKIDRSFTSRLPEDERTRAVVRTIVTLARDLGLEVVAEGVERAEEVTALKAMNCRLAQGYLYGAAMDNAAALALLQGQ
jgi:diguanylate cyclase (GGDEF)-like protein/PAS domain S-box-containing protein